MLFWLSVFGAGLSLGCVLLMLSSPWAQALPAANPGGFRARAGIFWPWVHTVAVLCRPLVTWAMRQRLAHLSELAGLDTYCLPEHVVALGVLAFLGGCVAGVSGASAAGVESMTMAALVGLLAGAVFAVLPTSRLKRRARDRQLDMLRAFPFLLDMTTLCVEAGLNLQGALLQATAHGPEGGLKHTLSRALSDMRAGVPRMVALKTFAARTGLPEVAQWVLAMEQADQLGMSLGPILRAQSEQRRNERFLRAEKLALEAPVKMLFPMVTCIFPCTFLVIGFPIGMKLLAVEF